MSLLLRRAVGLVSPAALPASAALACTGSFIEIEHAGVYALDQAEHRRDRTGTGRSSARIAEAHPARRRSPDTAERQRHGAATRRPRRMDRQTAALTAVVVRYSSCTVNVYVLSAGPGTHARASPETATATSNTGAAILRAAACISSRKTSMIRLQPAHHVKPWQEPDCRHRAKLYARRSRNHPALDADLPDFAARAGRGSTRKNEIPRHVH